MLHELFYSLHIYFPLLNVFQYITFRTALAALTAMIVTFVAAPHIIKRLKRAGMTQQIRDDGPKNHFLKVGTPTMGGSIILLSITVSMLMWGNLKNIYIWVAMASLLGLGAIGLLDDYLKAARKSPKGLKAGHKFGAQLLVAIAVVMLLHLHTTGQYATVLTVPFLKEWLFDIGIFYIPFAIFVIVSFSNAVNLTDGLDGLAVGLVAIITSVAAVLVYLSGHAVFADHLCILFLPGVGELTVFCGAMLGATLSFLWYNAHPAEVFMGDVGSLGLGGAIGALAVMSKHEIVLAIAGGIFVMEAASVILQVLSFKFTGKRIFKMAPLHHHFELKGWPESKVLVRFWIIGIILALIALATLRLR